MFCSQWGKSSQFLAPSVETEDCYKTKFSTSKDLHEQNWTYISLLKICYVYKLILKNIISRWDKANMEVDNPPGI